MGCSRAALYAYGKARVARPLLNGFLVFLTCYFPRSLRGTADSRQGSLHSRHMASEASDDELDDYFERLCAACPSDDDYEEQILTVAPTKAGKGNSTAELSETEYFAAMSESAAQYGSAVLGEESLVWQSLLRSAHGTSGGSVPSSSSSTYTKLQLVTSGTQKELLSQWLFSHLPASSTCFVLLKRLVLGDDFASDTTSDDCDDEMVCFSDHIQFPSVVLLLTKRRTPPVQESDLGVNLFSSIVLSDPLALEVVNVLIYHKTKRKRDGNDDLSPETGVAENTQRITFASIDVYNVHDSLSRALTSRGLRQSWVEMANLWVLCDSWRSASRNLLPPEYSSGPLTLEEALMVNDTWKYKSGTSITRVRSMIQNFPTMAIRTKEGGSLVAWCLTYRDGALGMLYTRDGWRGKGLAKCVVALLLGVWLQSNQCCPFCFITPGNDTSARVFSQLGFEKKTDCEWQGVTF